MFTDQTQTSVLGRRAFLQHGALFFAATAASTKGLFAQDFSPKLRIGVVTDLHYADKPAAGKRHYRESIGKLAAARAEFQKNNVDLVVELGDLVDAADTPEIEQGYLKSINREFVEICQDRHYVLGNHCVDTLTKDEFLGGVEQQQSYYSFDRAGFHFVVLDACFRKDGQPYGRKNSKWNDANIPPQELEWLQADLKQATGNVIVLAHQRLDVSNDYGVRNCDAVRKFLEASGQVLAVFQGHNHINDLKQIAGIHYCTLTAMVDGEGPENSGSSIVQLDVAGNIRVSGFLKHKTYQWDRPA
ncbi:MAG TPA: metallophosphoesterase [Schlesneria sp.]|jgi:alkaline phosphatase